MTAADAAASLEVSDATRLVAAPSVSVLMLAYNHGPYLAEAIESVLAQDCPFAFELLIGEDCSTDDSRAIALRYQQAHPERVRVVFADANVGFLANNRRLFERARGEFIAYCEGDDYWCRRDKLAAQVALLRADPRAAMVHADWVRARQREGSWQVDWRRPAHRRVPARLLRGDLFAAFYYGRILRTCTVLQRRSCLAGYYASPLGTRGFRFIDTARSAFLTAAWPVAYWPEVAAVYRESPGSALRSGQRSFLGFLRSALEFDTEARLAFRDRADYPASYRLECAVGLAVRALRLGDVAVAREAWADLRAHFGPIAAARAAWAALRLRWPSLRAAERQPPPVRAG